MKVVPLRVIRARENAYRAGGQARAHDQPPISVADIMQPEPLTISADAPLQDALTQMLESESGCLLVVSGRQLLGIVTERDLLEAAVDLIP